MSLKFEKEVQDPRGKIIFLSTNYVKINIIEIKKGFARGGHFHSYDSNHMLLTGSIECRKENMITKEEEIKIFNAPSIIQVDANIAHLFIALEDSVFVETINGIYDGVNYSKYRMIVEEKIQSQ